MRTLVTVVAAVLVAHTTVAAAAAPSTPVPLPTTPRLRGGPADLLDSDRKLKVFGADDRREVSDTAIYPYSAVGLLKWSADRVCTASLIGSKYVLTAADCVLTRDGTRRVSTLPSPELVFGSSASSSTLSVANVVKIHKQTDYWKQWTQQAYAILELDKPLGDSLGTLLLPSADDLDQADGKTPVQLVGFDDEAATSPTAALKFAKCTCYFPGSFNGPQYMLHHDCDTSPVGSPGSVMFVRYTSMETYIIGIHTNAVGDDVPAIEADATLAGYTDDVANRGVLGPFIKEQLQDLIKTQGLEEEAPAGLLPGTADAGSDETSEAASSRAVGEATVVSTVPPSDGDSSVGSSSSDSKLSATTVYICIGFVGCAWACIVFIGLRNARRRAK